MQGKRCPYAKEEEMLAAIWSSLTWKQEGAFQESCLRRGQQGALSVARALTTVYFPRNRSSDLCVNILQSKCPDGGRIPYRGKRVRAVGCTAKRDPEMRKGKYPRGPCLEDGEARWKEGGSWGRRELSGSPPPPIFPSSLSVMELLG